jgi:hypothetical protein
MNIVLSYMLPIEASLVIFCDQYDLVIIAPSMFSNALQPLIDHKNSHGVKTFVKTTEEIYAEYDGYDAAEQIKYFIKDAIEQFNIHYVLLVGGKDKIPARYVYITSDSSRFISDLYYADIYNTTGGFCSWNSNNNSIFGEMNDTNIIDAVDLNPDICLGRLLCTTESEVSTVVNKIIEYESTNTGSTTWFKNMILCGGDTHTYKVIEFLIPLLLKRTGRIAFEGEYISKQIASLLEDFNSKKIFASKNIEDNTLKFTTENIKNAINEGAGFLLFSTHGNTDKILTHPPFNKNVWLPSSSGYSSADVLDLRNGEKLPIAVFEACLSGDFDTSESPLAWEFIKHNDGGSIASVAATTISEGLPGTLCTETLQGYLTKEFFTQYSEGKDILGELWKESIKCYLSDEEALRIGAPNITYGRLTIIKAPCFLNHVNVENWILLGDPSLKIGGYG